MAESNKVLVSQEALNSLVRGIKGEIRKEKGLLLLGTFNQKIPVLLKSASKETLIDLIFKSLRRNSSIKYRIHFRNPTEAWEIHALGSNELLFTFNIPDELQKILAGSDKSGKYLDVKEGFLSVLNFSVRFQDISINLRLKIDEEWLSEMRSNL